MSSFEITEEDVEAGGIRLFTSIEECNKAATDETIGVAIAAGFDTIAKMPHSFICGKHSTAELVEVFLDGSWEYRDSTDDEVKKRSSPYTIILKFWLAATPEERNEFYKANP